MRLFNKSKGWKEEVEILVIEKKNFLISLQSFNYKESYLLMDYISKLLITLYGNEVRSNIEELSPGDTLKPIAIYISLRWLCQEESAQKVPEVKLIRWESTLGAFKSINIPIITPEKCELMVLSLEG